MKYILLLMLLCPLLLWGTASSHTIDIIDLEFNPSTYSFNYKFGYVSTTAPGSYRLPVKVFNIILPPEASELVYNYSISSILQIPAPEPKLNTSYYSSEAVLSSRPELQPSSHLIYQGTGKWGEVLFARFAVLPTLYDSEYKAYNVIDRLELTLNYTAASSKQQATYAVPAMLAKDISFINQRALAEWYPAKIYRTYDYLIVTTPALYASAQVLVDFRQNQGLVTAFADINTILSTSAGTTPADKLRNYLINEYLDSPFSYLLLIGDIDVVPIAYLTPEPNGNETVPSDFYYSDLSSDFDSNSNGKLGEYDTGMDYTPELFVGRIPWNDAAKITQICNRIVNFEANNGTWKNKALLPAAMLNYANEEPGFEATDGATFMEYSKATVLRNYQNTTLYEQAGLIPSYSSTFPLTATNLSNLVNSQSWGIVNWSAHGSPTTSARKIWLNDYNNNNIPEPQEMQWNILVNLDTFTNPVNQDGSVYFCASCLNGKIDNAEPSLGEYLIWKKSVANIAATRNGWYKLGWENPGWGGLSSYNYHFLENYAFHKMSVGQAHAYANWLHTQYCLFGDPVDSGGIIWPELQNIYTYLLYGDPAIGYTPQTLTPAATILIWEPFGNTGFTIINNLLDIAPFNVVYSRHLIDTYNYLNQFDVVFCLFGFGDESYTLQPTDYEYSYLLSYLQQGGKVYLEGMPVWDPADSLFGRFGTIAPYDHVALIEQLQYISNDKNLIWDYNGYNEGTPALAVNSVTANALFHSLNQNHVNDIIGVYNRIGESRTISSSFNLAGAYSDVYENTLILRIILDTLGVYQYEPVSITDETTTTPALIFSAAPNPFSEHLTIELKSDSPVRIEVFNIKGQRILSERIFPKNGSIIRRINARDKDGKELPTGVYLLKVANAESTAVRKLLKLK